MYNQISLWDDLADTNNMKVENQVNKETIISTDGEVILYQNFFSTKESIQLFEDLSSNVKWKQEIIQIFGKKMPIPRLTAWYGDEGKS
ncbi:MAG: alpha-ketoglutarate-dependent dioxygenase AlkB, partial [Dolichospermum circinale Clear-D4]|nr:alpha-ketoglutarate-dependent dioxygenase AlkB [Dolichospermum circinale Clear-D4]